MDSVDVKSLTANESLLSEHDLELYRKNSRIWPKTPFPIDEEINKRVILYDGDIELLRAEALVNPTNENLTQINLVNKLAGPDLENFIRKKVRMCATGDVRVTPGFKSNFDYIIHAVPPKYQPKYKTAAESALFHTYFRILETMIEKKIRTVIMPTLATSKCNLPIEENIQMQLRIIRRMLEKKCREFDKIVVHAKDIDLYKTLFFCYFPREDLDQEVACYKLDSLIGGINGEPVIPGREIRIKSKPSNSNNHLNGVEHSIDLTSGLDLSTVVGKTAFCKMRESLDDQRRNLSLAPIRPTAKQFIGANRKALFRGCSLL